MSDPAIEIIDLKVSYSGRSHPTLKGLSLRVDPGEFVLLTGPTGCGKSTLLKTINGLIPHVVGGTLHGRVAVDGIETRQAPMSALSQKVGLVFQNPEDQIFSTMVLDEVAFGPENLALPREEIRRRVETALEAVGLDGLGHRGTQMLSGGQKQRLAIGSVLSMAPDILLLDEPFAQLDPRGTREVLEVVRKLNAQGMTVILVEHRIHEVIDVVDRVVVMDRGRIALDGDPRRVFEKSELLERLGIRIPDSVELSWKMGFDEVALNLADVQRKLNGQGGVGAVRGTSPSWSGRTFRPLPDEPVLEAESVTFRYDRKKEAILDNVSLTVRKGEMVALMGNNGSGKSTLLHQFAGLLKPGSGTVRVCGHDTRRSSPWKLAGEVGIVFQNPTLMLFNETVREEMEHGPKTLRMDETAMKRTVSEIADRLGVVPLERDNPLALSGGQRLRVALAAILTLRPSVVLLDEPTSGQDRGNCDSLLQYLRSLSRRGVTVLFSTHDVDAAIRFSERLVVMKDGKILADDAPGEVVRRGDILEQACLRPPLSFEIGRLLNIEAFTCEELLGRVACSR